MDPRAELDLSQVVPPGKTLIVTTPEREMRFPQGTEVTQEELDGGDLVEESPC